MKFFKKRSTNIRLEDVLIGQKINIEHDRAKGGFAQVECLGNEPNKKKIFLKILWDDIGEEKFILKYNDKKLKNFSLINKDRLVDPVEKLRIKLTEALKNEEYEIADKLTKEIEKLRKNESNK